jgi:hypothetical protein
MEVSILLAKLLGVYLIVVSLAVSLNKELYDRMLKEYAKNPLAYYPFAVVTLILGLLMVNLHNEWVAGWQVVVTLVAWGTVVKGFIGLVFPSILVGIAKAFKDRVYYNLAILIALLIGVYLTYVGFWS